jgi:hypothetical protein
MKRREFIALGAATLATGCAGVARRINPKGVYPCTT